MFTSIFFQRIYTYLPGLVLFISNDSVFPDEAKDGLTVQGTLGWFSALRSSPNRVARY